MVPVRYRLELLGQTVDGIARLGTIPAAVVPPPSESTYSNGITYGLADSSGSPVGTAQNSAAFSLSVGASHTTASLDFPVTTATNNVWYIELPAGLTFIRAYNPGDGDDTASWVRQGSTQRWTNTIGFGNAEKSFAITVRRTQ